ncbi:putative ribonuclease H-like domain-containing protein [Tanacetum coccineum]
MISNNNLRVYEDEMKRSGRNQGKRSYGDNGRSNAPTNESSSQALVAQDGLGGYDWSNDFEVEPVNYALMAISSSSSSSSSDNEKVVKERDELKLKIEKWEESSKNLDELLNSQMSARDKTGLGYGTQLNEMSNNSETDSEISLSVFYVRSSLDEYAIRKKIIESKIIDLNTKTSETVDDEDDVSDVQTVSPVKTNESQTVKTRVDEIGQSSQKQGIGFKKIKACFVCKRVLTRTGLITPVKQNEKRAVYTVRTARPVSTARPVITARPVSAAKPVSTARHGNPEILLQDHAMVDSGLENQLNNNVKIIRCDNGTEFKNQAMNEFCAKKGIKREFSMARTPQHNGVAKRKNKTLIEAARTMLADSLLPIPFWAEEVNTSYYVLNRVLVTKSQNKTPYELLIDKMSRSEDVADKEGQHQLTEDEQVLHDELEKMIAQEVVAKALDDYSQGANAGDSSFVYLRGKIPIDASTFPNADLPIDPNMPDLEDDSDAFSSYGIFNRAYDDENMGAVADFNNMDDTINFKLQKVWILIDLPSGKKAIGTKLGFKNKRDERICCEKQSLAYSKGFRQEDGIDYDAVFALYLKHQPKLGLWYPKDSPFELEAFSDSDYGGASLDKKSTTGGCQFLGRRLISWQCKKQTIVANSTTEAEYVAAAHCCGQVLWIQNQMMDYGFNFMNTKIHIDNESIISVIKNHVAHSRTKHIEIRFHFIRDCYEKRLIEVIKIHTDSNVTDLLTKGFDVTGFNLALGLLVVNNITNGHQFTISNRLQELASPKQNSFGKDFSNPLMVDSLPKTIWLSMHHVITMKHWLTKANGLGKDFPNPFMAGSLPNTIKQSNDPPLSRGYILGSGKDSLELKELMENCTQIVCFVRKKNREICTTEEGLQAISATIDGHEKLITEDSLRRHLKLDDAESISSLSNEEIFEHLAHMGSKKTAWDQCSSNIATALICLATRRRFNFSKFIFEAMVKNLDSLHKFLLYPSTNYKASSTKDLDLFLQSSLTALIQDEGTSWILQEEEVHEKPSDETEVLVQEPTEIIKEHGSVKKGEMEISTANIQVSIASLINVSTVVPHVYTIRSAKDKGKAIMEELATPKKVKKRTQVQLSMDKELARKIEEEERIRFNAEQEARALQEEEEERLNLKVAKELQRQLDQRL